MIFTLVHSRYLSIRQQKRLLKCTVCFAFYFLTTNSYGINPEEVDVLQSLEPEVALNVKRSISNLSNLRISEEDQISSKLNAIRLSQLSVDEETYQAFKRYQYVGDFFNESLQYSGEMGSNVDITTISSELNSYLESALKEVRVAISDGKLTKPVKAFLRMDESWRHASHWTSLRVRKDIQSIDQLIEESMAKMDSSSIKTFAFKRGISNSHDVLPSFSVGDHVFSRGYTSTTYDIESTTIHYSDRPLWIVYEGKSAAIEPEKGSAEGTDMREIIYGRNTRFQIIGKASEDSKTYLYLRQAFDEKRIGPSINMYSGKIESNSTIDDPECYF